MTILGESQAAVGMSFGLLEAAALPGPVLVTMMGDLGFGEAAARGTLARMLRNRELEATHRGRVAIYRLSGRHLHLFNLVKENPSGPPWTGKFHTVVYDIAESDRRMRDWVRRKAFEAGYGSPRPGVLISVTDRSEWVDALRSPSRMLETGEFSCDLATARRLADRAWNLEEIGAQVEASCRALEAKQASSRPTPSGTEAVRALHVLWNNISMMHQQIPLLPAEFLPKDWSLDRLYELTFLESERYEAAVGEYQQQVIDTWRHADLIEFARTDPSWRDDRDTPAAERWKETRATDTYRVDDIATTPPMPTPPMPTPPDPATI